MLIKIFIFIERQRQSVYSFADCLDDILFGILKPPRKRRSSTTKQLVRESVQNEISCKKAKIYRQTDGAIVIMRGGGHSELHTDISLSSPFANTLSSLSHCTSLFPLNCDLKRNIDDNNINEEFIQQQYDIFQYLVNPYDILSSNMPKTHIQASTK